MVNKKNHSQYWNINSLKINEDTMVHKKKETVYNKNHGLKWNINGLQNNEEIVSKK